MIPMFTLLASVKAASLVLDEIYAFVFEGCCCILGNDHSLNVGSTVIEIYLMLL